MVSDRLRRVVLEASSPEPEPEVVVVETKNPPTPVEASSKAVGGGKWALLAASIWQTIVVADILPAPYNGVEFTTAVMGLVTAIAGVVGTYRAPPNRG